MMKEVVYKMLDVLTGKKGLGKTINGFHVKLPTRYVNYFPADYEKENFEFLKQQVKEGNVVLDIGAHIGLFAAAAAQLTGKAGMVHAFEPSVETHTLLKQTVAINHLHDVIIPYNAAIGALSGKTTFYVSAIKGDNSNSLVSYKNDRHLFAREVQLYSIDDFIREKNIKQLAFIKIDVEGAEYDALRGATGTFRNLRPACILAIHPEAIEAKGDNIEKIHDLIVDCNYRIYYQNRILSKFDLCNNKELIDLHLLPL